MLPTGKRQKGCMMEVFCLGHNQAMVDRTVSETKTYMSYKRLLTRDRLRERFDISGELAREESARVASLWS